MRRAHRQRAARRARSPDHTRSTSRCARPTDRRRSRSAGMERGRAVCAVPMLRLTVSRRGGQGIMPNSSRMLTDGFSTRSGRRGCRADPSRRLSTILLRGRRGARLTALTSGGAIPDTADYRVVMEPENLTVGSVNEDFAVESMSGDVFQLGNSAYRIIRVERGTVRVEDAREACRRRSRSGLAKRRRAATNCRHRCRGYAAKSPRSCGRAPIKSRSRNGSSRSAE